MKLAPMIRNARAEADLSLRVLAQRVRCSPSHLSRLERGERGHVPSKRLIERLARALGLNLDVLLLASGRIPADVLHAMQKTPNACNRVRRMRAVA
jgi:transcriptional regulator with XRE-family HTH domain